MDRELLMAPRTFGLVGRLMLGLMAGALPATALPAMALPLAPAHGAGDPATAGDDRAVLEGFLTGAPLTNRRLLDDLARTEWSPQEIREALVKVYGVKVERVSRFLDSPAGRVLVDQHVEGWSPLAVSPTQGLWVAFGHLEGLTPGGPLRRRGGGCFARALLVAPDHG